MIKKELNSNKMKSKVCRVCRSCGITANVLTCLKKFGKPPTQISFSVSTFCKGFKCDYCGKNDYTTEVRDFFYPDFSLIEVVVGYLKYLKSNPTPKNATMLVPKKIK